MRKEFWNHGSTRMRGANACAFVRTGALRQFKKGRTLVKTIRVIRGLILAMVSAAMAFPVLAAEPTVSVTAQQRYPWNGMVDVAFTITGESGTKYDTSFIARDVAGGTNLTMKTIYKSDGSAVALTNQLVAGSYKWVWNAAADLPNGFTCERVAVDVNATAHQGLYMVIDLSGGSSATSYPVSYLDAVPSGGWTTAYKTSKLVLRRIESGTNSAGGSMAANMWVGVFEVTQAQSDYLLNLSYDWRSSTIPCTFTRAVLLSHDSLDISRLLNAISSRVSILSGIRLPTKLEWQYVCRAGTTTTYSYGNNADGSYMWYNNNSSSATHPVGTKLPNAWGLYDMHGNKEECVSDSCYYVGGNGHYVCGGSYESSSQNCTSASAYGDGGYSGSGGGVRIFATCK